VVLLASLAKEFGWSEEFILWHLPLSRALQYWHAIQWMRGAWTVAPGPSVSAQLNELIAAVDQIVNCDGDEI